MSVLASFVSGAAGGGGPAVSALDRGLLLGDGVFDTLVCRAGRAQAWSRHRTRLLAAAQTIGVALDADAVEAALAAIRRDLAGRDAILRLTATRGLSERGLWPAAPAAPTLVATAQAFSPGLVGAPARLVVATTPRNERSPLSRLKSLNYLDAVLAAREAAGAGADDALILNGAGRLACSTIANIAVLRGGRLLTPPTAEGCLNGIVRGLLPAAADGLGLSYEEMPLTLDDALGADAVILTNSVRVLRPVTAIGPTALPPAPPVIGALRAALETLLDTIP